MKQTGAHTLKHVNIWLKLAIFTALTVVAAEEQNTAVIQKQGVVADDGIGSIIDGTNKFAISLYRAIARKEKGNVFVSPLSAQMTLALAYTGARGQTAKELATLLSLPDKIEDTNAGYKTLIKVIQAPQINFGNSLFVEKTAGIKEEFQKNAKEFFQSPAVALDFVSDTEKSRKKINSWVETQTNKKITDLLKPGTITSDTKLVLVNAIHFKADWLAKFDKEKTKEESFHVSKTKTVQVKMMHATDEYYFVYDNDLKAKILIVYYKGRDTRMIIILPDHIDGLEELETKIEKVDLFKTINSARPENVTVAIPKFKIEETMKLKDTLKSLGAKQMFDEGKSDFSGLSDARLTVSEVFQKAFVEVNEEGTEASAGTAIEFHFLSAIKHAKFTADHPFMFIITTERKFNSEVSLFVGRVVEPNN